MSPKSVSASQRFTAGRKCPVCGGWDGGIGEKRCNGFIGDNGTVFCRRVPSDEPYEMWGVQFWKHRKQDAEKQEARRKRETKKVKGTARENPRRAPDLIHEYCDLDGQLVLQVLRWYLPPENPGDKPPKRISQRVPDPLKPGEWLWDGVTKRIPPALLYRWADTKAALELNQTLYITEGETDADAVVEAGFEATCNPMGAMKFRAEHAKWIASIPSSSQVVICMDRDEVGRRHAAEVKSQLLAHGVVKERVSIVQPAVGRDVREHLVARQGMDQLVEVLDEETNEAPITRLRTIALRSTVEAMLGDDGITGAPQRSYLIDGFLPDQIVGLVVAEGGTGKGHLIVNLGMSLALARPFGPFDIERECGWIYVTYEDDFNEVHRRIIHHRMAVADKLSLSEWERAAFLRNVRVIDYSGEMDAVLSKDLVEVLAQTRASIAADRCLITIDPLTKVLPSDVQLNSAEGSGEIMRYLWSLQSAAQCSVLALHHIRKPAQASIQDGKGPTQHDTMGSAQLVNLSRWVLNVSTVDAQELGFVGVNEAIRAEVTKSNYTQRIPPIGFVRAKGGAVVWREIPEDRLDDAEAAVINYLAKKGIVLGADLEKYARSANGLGLAKHAFEKARSSLADRGLIQAGRNVEKRVQYGITPKGAEVAVFTVHAEGDGNGEEEEEIF